MRIIPGLSLVMLTACAAPPVFTKASFAPPDPAEAPRLEQKKALARYYPQLLKQSIGGEQTIFFVTGANGRVQRTDVIRGLPPTGPTREALFWRFPDLKGDPALRESGVTIFEPGQAGLDKLVVIWAKRT